jgi:hypothetical protein
VWEEYLSLTFGLPLGVMHCKKEEKTLVDIITLLGVLRSSIKYRMVD